MRRTLLGVFAHPDDETFLAGPILARYAAEGVHVEVACATPPGAEDRDHYFNIRRRALHCAAQALGVQRIHFLNYYPSPMRPVHGPHHGMLAATPVARVAENLAPVFEGLQPDVVLVDSPYGAYGHPDHITAHRAAVAAFNTTAKREARLYSLAFPLPLVRLNVWLMDVLGYKPRALGPLGDIDLLAAVREAPKRTALINVSGYVRWRHLAGRCYADEIAAAPLPLKLLERLPLLQRLIFWRMGLTRMFPSPHVLERDLFPCR